MLWKSILKLSLIFLLTITLVLTLMLLTNQEFAQSESLSSISTRVSRLESDNARLRNQVNRLDSQLRSLATSTSQPKPNLEPLSQPPASSVEEPMFDRLATLVIELKERIIAIEKYLNLNDEL